MTGQRGGKRPGAGRPKGSTSASPELRQLAREHTDDALKAVAEIMKDPAHPQRLRACELVLQYGHGQPPKAMPEAEGIIQRFMADEISAIQACLLLEAAGGQPGNFLLQYAKREFELNLPEDEQERANEYFFPTQPLPRA